MQCIQFSHQYWKLTNVLAFKKNIFVDGLPNLIFSIKTVSFYIKELQGQTLSLQTRKQRLYVQ